MHVGRVSGSWDAAAVGVRLIHVVVSRFGGCDDEVNDVSIIDTSVGIQTAIYNEPNTKRPFHPELESAGHASRFFCEAQS